MGAGLRATRTLLGGRGQRAKGDRIMTEAGGAGGTRSELERTLVQRTLEDEDFRRRLLEDPKGTVDREMGIRMPEGIEVRAVQESTDTFYLVLPSVSPVGEGGELSELELEAVAGGGANKPSWDLPCQEGTTPMPTEDPSDPHCGFLPPPP
jgi:hypothetical protein